MTDIDNESIARSIMSLVRVVYKDTFGSNHHPHHMHQNPHGLPPSQIHVLVSLTKNPSMNMTELARALNVSVQQISKVVDELVKKGLVRRTLSETNRRMVFVELTEKGEAISQHQIKQRAQMIDDFFSDLTPEQKRTVLEALTIFREYIQKKMQ